MQPQTFKTEISSRIFLHFFSNTETWSCGPLGRNSFVSDILSYVEHFRIAPVWPMVPSPWNNLREHFTSFALNVLSVLVFLYFASHLSNRLHLHSFEQRPQRHDLQEQRKLELSVVLQVSPTPGWTVSTHTGCFKKCSCSAVWCRHQETHTHSFFCWFDTNGEQFVNMTCNTCWSNTPRRTTPSSCRLFKGSSRKRVLAINTLDRCGEPWANIEHGLHLRRLCKGLSWCLQVSDDIVHAGFGCLEDWQDMTHSDVAENDWFCSKTSADQFVTGLNAGHKLGNNHVPKQEVPGGSPDGRSFRSGPVGAGVWPSGWVGVSSGWGGV